MCMSRARWTQNGTAACWPGLAGLLALTLAGCPTQEPTPAPAVTAVITISSPTGTPPLTVSVSGAASTSRNGGPLRFAWDFGGQAQAEGETAWHIFTQPGFYQIVLTVTDPTGATGTTRQEVRVRGGDPTAVIQASTNAGPVPLPVYFNGAASFAPDDTIRDYAWNFGDGARSGERAPVHVYRISGRYTVTLTVTTGGGASASTTTVIDAGGRNGSLQFDGSQFATLPLAGEQTLDACTFEAWFKAGTGGGTLVSVGDGALTIAIRPSESLIRLQAGGVQHDVSAAALTGQWRHVAVTYHGTGNATVYLDGVALGNVPAAGPLTAAKLTLGLGFSGKVADVRFWSAVRGSADIAANYARRLSGTPPALLGYWRLDDGSGQVLTAQIGVNGTRGPSAAAEASDPAWSTDGPPLP